MARDFKTLITMSGVAVPSVSSSDTLTNKDLSSTTNILPTASTSVAGVVKVDGTSITVSGGVISGSGGTTNTFNDIHYAQSGLTSSGITALTGTVDGSNTTFTVPGAVYAIGTLSVYKNGILQVLGDAITQTTPASGIFDFVTAPAGASQLYVEFYTIATNSASYAIPAQTGNSGKFLTTDGSNTSWGVGGGSPGGSTTQIQFNDGGSFAGDSDMTWDKTTNTFSMGGTDTTYVQKAITNEPSVAPVGTLRYYSKSIAGKMFPKIVGPAGIDTPLQNAFWQNNIVMWNPTTATAGSWLGSAGAGAGTYSTALPTTTSLYTAMKRARWANIVTTVNQILGQRSTEAGFMLSPSNAGQGGFFFYARFGFDVWTDGSRAFAGMHTSTGVVTGNPSAHNNSVGFAVDDTDAGLIYFQTKAIGSATRVSTGFTITSGKGYDVYITCLPGTNTYYWRIVDTNAGTEASGTATSTVPANNTMAMPGVLASNAALTPVTSIQLGLNRIYVESDR